MENEIKYHALKYTTMLPSHSSTGDLYEILYFNISE